jgi:molybdopterin-guanine dinucleotide biosynthesis protein A
VIIGSGEIPNELAEHPRLPDVPDAQGPMAALLSAMRWAPQVSWLVAACDLPEMSLESLHWLLGSRPPGLWATLPSLAGKAVVEPLLAYYDFRCGQLLEEMAANLEFSLSRLVAHPKVISPAPPDQFSCAWQNINTPDQHAHIGSHSQTE